MTEIKLVYELSRRILSLDLGLVMPKKLGGASYKCFCLWF